MKIIRLDRLMTAAGVIFAVLVASPASAIPPPPIPPAPPSAATYSADQLATTPAVDLARQLFSDWARDLVEKRPGEGPSFYTRPRAGYAGVCEVTRVRFGMAAQTGRSADGSAYVEGVEVERLYRYVDLPGPFDPTRGAQFDATRSLCNALAPGASYFPAPSALAAAYQRHVIADAISKANSRGELGFALDCLPGAGESCRARDILATLNASDIKGIRKRDCPGYSRDECDEVSVGDWVLETDSRLSTYGYSLTEPDRILVAIGLSRLPHDLAVDCPQCR